MNTYIISLISFLLVTGIMLVATTSIAIECYNKCKEIKEAKRDNFSFLVSNLVSAIVMILFSFAMMYVLKDKNLY